MAVSGKSFLEEGVLKEELGGVCKMEKEKTEWGERDDGPGKARRLG